MASDSTRKRSVGDVGRPLVAFVGLEDDLMLDTVASLMLVMTRFRVRHELTANELAIVIQVIARRRTTSTALSDDVGLSLASTGKLLDALERAGWVTRARDERDRRRTIVQPSKRLVRAMLELTDQLREGTDADPAT